MKRISLILLFFLLCIHTSILAQNWHKKYESVGSDFGNSIIEYNNQLFIGITNDGACKLLKTDLNGNIISQTSFSNLFRTSTILLSSDNNLIVVGNDIANNGVVVLKLDLNFNQIWATRSSYAGYNFAECAIRNSNGDITVCGYSSSDPNSTANRNGLIMRFNNSGQVLWSQVLTYAGTDYFSGICEGMNGEMVLTGAFQGGAGLMDLAIYKINSNGDALYLKLYGGGQNDGGYSVDFFNNQYYISGNTWSTGAGDQDLLLMKFSENMNLVWAKVYGKELIEPGLYVTHSTDGNLILVGQTNSTNAKARDICLLKINENGGVIKMKNIGGSNDEAIAFGYKVLYEKNDSYYIVCGSSSNSVDYDVLLYHTNMELDDLCCRTIETLQFTTADANLNMNSTNFSINTVPNSNAFTAQKSALNLGLGVLCTTSNNIDVALYFDNTKTCEKIPINFQSMTSTSGLSYTWNFGDPSSGTNNTSTNENPSHLYNNAGTYLVTLIGTDGCSVDTDTMSVYVKQSIILDNSISPIQQAYCSAESINFTAISNDPSATHLWNFDDVSSGANNTSTSTNPTHIFNNPGFYKVVLKSMNNCHVDSSEITIKILGNNPPAFDFSIDSCLGNLQLVNTDNSDLNTYQWVYNNTVFSTSKNSTYELENDGVYEFSLIQNPNTNCSDTITQSIDFKKLDQTLSILIPEIFSPNGDGKNDIFEITGNIKCNLKSMKIFNRWGIAYYSTTSTFSWDGKLNGANVPEGSYIVYLEYADQKIIKTIYVQR